MSSEDTIQRSSLWFRLAALTLLLLGLAIRLFDLTDPPYDFHTTRQLHSAIVARGMYYAMQPNADPELRERALAYAKSAAIYETPILERLSALTYLAAGQEVLWAPRLYNTLLWMLGGIFLLPLARRMFPPDKGEPAWVWGAAALVALAYYLLLPLAVQGSRSFQPDAAMVVFMLLALWAAYTWADVFSWRWAVAAGLLAGLAILVKPTAVYVLGPALAVLVFVTLGWRRFWRSPQVWAIALLSLAPAVLARFLAPGSVDASTYFENTTGDLLHLLLEPTFYIGWLHFLQSLLGLSALLAALVGMLLAPPRTRLVLLAVWVGYLIYGATFPYQMSTHNYYHLRLIPLLAVSLFPVLQAVFLRLVGEGRLARLGVTAVALLALAYGLWASYAALSKVDYRGEPARWQSIGAALPQDGKVIALTQDYGFSLMYYGWRKVDLWPPTSEIRLKALRGNNKPFDQLFERYVKNKDYFLVTDFEQWQQQPELRQVLEASYPLVVDTEQMKVYDLTP